MAATVDTAPLPPTAAASPVSQPKSRYRTLRGKSMSSPRLFDIFRDEDARKDKDAAAAAAAAAAAQDTTSGAGLDQQQQQATPTRRSRSNSIVSFKSLGRREKTPEVPPLPNFALAPKPVNIPAPPKFKPRDRAKRPPQATPVAISAAAFPSVPVSALGATPAAADKADNEGDNGQEEDEGEKENKEQDQEVVRPATAPSRPTQPTTYKAFPSESRSPSTEQQQQQQQQQLQIPQRQSNEEAERAAAERSRQEQDDKWADEVKRVGAETDRILSEQKKKDLARLESTLQTPPHKTRRGLLDKLAFFSKSKRYSPPTSSQPGTPSTVATTAFSPNMSRGTSLETAPSPPVSTILETGAAKDIAVTPSPKRPITAIERRVAVRCLSTTISLPVSQETSAVDIMCMASTMTRHHICPSSAVVAESYLMLGLERRIRRYERIRDVMNTWDKDHENSLLILTSDTAAAAGARAASSQAQDQDQDLDIDAAAGADEIPSGFTLQMHHSARPGKWNKRWITLLGNGQVFAAKHADVLPSDKESVLLCHMSDFDIYSAKEAEMRQSIRPPKRFCYAVKSQQPTGVFPEGENFVHFFSTDDEALAASFFEHVHAWRSWFLANRYRTSERKRTAKPPRISFIQGKPASRTGDEPRQSAAGAISKSPSSAPSPFRTGGFELLFDVDNLEAISEEASKLGPLVESAAEELVRQKRASDESKASASSQEKRAASNTIVRASDRDPGEDDLLGEVYDHLRSTGSQRPKEPVVKAKIQQPVSEPSQEAKPSRPPPPSQPQSQAPSLLPARSDSIKALHTTTEPPQPKAEPSSWFPSAAEHSARLRSQSVHSSIRRPMTADAASSPSHPPPSHLQVPTMSASVPTPQRRAKPSGLCINTNFPEPPRFPASPQGMRSPQSPNHAFPAKIPGTPLPPPRGRFLPRSSSSGTLNQASPVPGMGGSRPRSRSTAGSSPGSRRMVPEGAPPPPVPPLPSYSPRREQMSAPPQRPAPAPPRARPVGPVPMVRPA